MAPTKPRESKNTLQEVRIRHALEERRLEDTSFRKLADKYGVSSSTLSDRELFFFFFLFIHYSYATYVDHDGAHVRLCTVRFPAAVRV